MRDWTSTDPRGADRKRLVSFVEIDRCATDAIAVVTGCRLGKRALKFRDWGKMAATFIDLTPKDGEPAKAIRIAARESSKDRARELYPAIENKNLQQMQAYREMPDADLFTEQWVTVPLHAREMPGYKAGRITCAACGEGINFDRQIEREGKTLCQACANPEVPLLPTPLRVVTNWLHHLCPPTNLSSLSEASCLAMRSRRTCIPSEPPPSLHPSR